MKNTVQIGRHTFTRAQVAEGRAQLEKAQAELDSPRESVVFDGTVVTRAQLGVMRAEIEKAEAELNRVTHLTPVRRKGSCETGVVLVDGFVQQTYARGAGVSGRFTVVLSRGSGVTYYTEDAVREHWEVIEQ